MEKQKGAMQEVLQQKSRQDMFSKPGAPQHEEMLNVQVKNTKLHLNGQNLPLAAKNGRNSKTPGLHLSAAHGKEAVGRLTACSLTHEGTAQLHIQLKPPGSDVEKEAENQPARRPLTLAPLELPEEVREAQRQKLKFIQQDDKHASHKQDERVTEPRTRKVKSGGRLRLVPAAVCPSLPSEPLKAQQPNRPSRPQLTRCVPVEQNADGHLEDVVCRGTPLPLHNKPAPPLFFPRVKARAARGEEEEAAPHPNRSGVQQETGSRRPRLRRAQCLEEDQSNSNTSMGGLSADKDKLAQGVRGEGQRTERAVRGQTHAGKGIKQSPAACWEHRSAGKSHQEDCSQQSASCTLNRQSAEGASSERALDALLSKCVAGGGQQGLAHHQSQGGSACGSPSGRSWTVELACQEAVSLRAELQMVSPPICKVPEAHLNSLFYKSVHRIAVSAGGSEGDTPNIDLAAPDPPLGEEVETDLTIQEPQSVRNLAAGSDDD
ncbi:uncharacterized protein V6R79_021528 [Siganus canaliculatus]